MVYETITASRLVGAQKAFILEQAEERLPVGEVCRKAGISHSTFCVYGPLSLSKRFEINRPSTGANVYLEAPQLGAPKWDIRGA